MKIREGIAVILLAIAVMSCSDHEQHGINLEPSALAKATHPGARVYQSACMSCHALATKEEGVAPPLFGVKDHVLKAYPERAAFIQRIVAWVQAPNPQDVLMPGAVKKFGLMPAQTQLSEADLQAVAEFIYDTDLTKPDWYAAHYQAEHGKKP
ncbi:MAG: cytochrome c [Thiothrix sp.]|nr:MAG: cytochrome c [Thiothrix sp.]